MRQSPNSSGAVERAIAIGLVLLCVAISFSGVVFAGGRRVLFFEDIAAYFEPLWTAAARAMRSGQWPSWALEAWSGQYLIGDPQVGIFYPPHWIWIWIAPVRAYAISILGHTFWAGLGMIVLGRRLGRSWPACAASALAFSLSAYFVLEARHEMFLVSAAWLPWMLAGVAWSAQAGGAAAMIAIAVAFGLALLGGGWSMLVFAAPVVLVFAIGRTRSRRRLVEIGLGLGLGLGLAAVQIVPALAHARLSPRALPLAESFSGSYAWPSLRYAISLVLPLWYGDDARGTYTGAPDQWELCGYGVGLVAAALAALALRRRRGRGEVLAYLALVAIAALCALGPNGPLWPLVRSLPIVGRTRCPARALFVYTLIAPMLCALGVDGIRAWLPRRARRIVWAAPLFVAAELLSTFRAENPSVDFAQTRIEPAVLARLPRSPSEDRTLIDVHLGQRFHNGGLRWGIETPGGYSSLPLWRYLHLLWIANHGHPYPGWPRPSLAHDLSAQGLWTLGSPLVDALSVRWALLPHDRVPEAAGWTRVEAGTDGIDLWRNEEALPRAYVVHRAVRVADEAAAAEAIASAAFAPSQEVIVEEPVALPVPDVPAPYTAARLVAREGADARFLVDAAAGGVLVFAEPHEPSWTVAVDDKDAPLLRVDYALMGVRIEAGAHTIVFRRRDRALRCGALVTLGSLLSCLVLLAWSHRRTVH